MNHAINLTILRVINDRKTAHIKELERITTDKRVKDASKAASLFARIDECDQFLSLITKSLDETAEQRLRDLFKDQQGIDVTGEFNPL